MSNGSGQASEVKILAAQTARATQEIAAKVSEIIVSTDASVVTIVGIADVIERIGRLSGDISDAVEEQGVATRLLARTSAHTSQDTRAVSGHISGVERVCGLGPVRLGPGACLSERSGASGQGPAPKVGGFLATVRAA